jgi:hypothetical protein
MARGFESKDVEFQQAEAERERRLPPPKSESERLIMERRQTLNLSLTRKRAELAAAVSDPHRRMVQQAIDALERALQDLPE